MKHGRVLLSEPSSPRPPAPRTRSRPAASSPRSVPEEWQELPDDPPRSITQLELEFFILFWRFMDDLESRLRANAEVEPGPLVAMLPDFGRVGPGRRRDGGPPLRQVGRPQIAKDATTPRSCHDQPAPGGAECELPTCAPRSANGSRNWTNAYV
jgi:hypothetical protein